LSVSGKAAEMYVQMFREMYIHGDPAAVTGQPRIARLLWHDVIGSCQCHPPLRHTASLLVERGRRIICSGQELVNVQEIA
jgi:hypothetical protein